MFETKIVKPFFLSLLARQRLCAELEVETCITERKAQEPHRTCNEIYEEEDLPLGGGARVRR